MILGKTQPCGIWESSKQKQGVFGTGEFLVFTGFPFLVLEELQEMTITYLEIIFLSLVYVWCVHVCIRTCMSGVPVCASLWGGQN